MFTLTIAGRLGLNDPHSIPIPQSAAKALFGNDNPMGKFRGLIIVDWMDVKSDWCL